MTVPNLQLRVDQRQQLTNLGGLSLAVALVKRFGVADRIDGKVELLKRHLPYHESDHVLALTLNLYAGGTCLEDTSRLQLSRPIQRMLGACRSPDPTTAGDFLRRFDEPDHRGSLSALRGVADDVQEAVWREYNRGWPKGKRPWGIVDMDGHIKEVYGKKKEGADFAYTGQWSYHPLLVSLANTGECLAVVNRPGNARSSADAAAVLSRQLRRLKPFYDNFLVRGDADFDRRDVRETCERHDAFFAFVGREFKDRPGLHSPFLSTGGRCS